MDAAFEVLKDGHGLLRELPGVRVWGVDDGALVLGEDATHFVFCHQGALTVRQNGAWPHVLTPGTLVLMPWQDATAACARPFVAGFDD